MVRELKISLYLFLYQIVFSIFNIFPVKNKITFIVSFGDNSLAVFEEMQKREVDTSYVFLYKRSCKYNIDDLDGVTPIPFESGNIFYYFKSIYHLATSKTIIIDNYYGFLSAVRFKKNVECIQLWHAAGAIKKFGLEDQSNQLRSSRATKRFKKVYKQFHKTVVGSESMANIFSQAFNLNAENILRTGVPRTDLFYDKEKEFTVKEKLRIELPVIQEKKVILYVPTYRDHQIDRFDLKLDLNLLKQELGDEYIVLLRLHPAIKNKSNYESEFPGFVYDFSSYLDVNELLYITDILISDYSSIPFEYAIMNKPMVFYAYDLDEYTTDRGLWDNYQSMVPGKITKTTAEVISQIKTHDFNYEDIRKFAELWNEYSNGASCENLVNYILGHDINIITTNATDYTYLEG